FELHGLIPETDYSLEVLAGTGSDGIFGEPLGDTVQARAGEAGVVLRLRASRGLSFRVIHQGTGAPIERFTAKAGGWWTEPLQDAEGTILTQHAGGRAVFQELSNLGQEDARLQIFSDGFEPYEQSGIQLPVEGLLDLGDVALKPAPMLQVKVLADASSLPVEGARVTLSVPSEGDPFAREFSRNVELHENPRDARMENRSKRTDAEGVVSLTAIPGQRTVLTVSHRKFAELELPARTYGAEEVVVRLLVGGEVRVTLLDAEGAPVARGVSVDHRYARGHEEGSLGYSSKQTNAKGIATFKNLSAGTHEFRVGRDLGMGRGLMMFEGLGSGGEGDSEPWVSVDVSEGSEDELVLRRAARGTLFGRVTEGGRPLPRAALRLVPWRGDSRGDARNSGARMVFFEGGGGGIESGSDGSYRMEERQVGEYELIISHPRRAMEDTIRVSITSGEVELDVDLPATAIEGVAVDQDGEPVPGLEVAVHRVEDPSAGGVGMGMIVGMGGLHVGFGGAGGPAKTDAAGRFEVRGLATGCELVLKLSGGKYQTELVEIDPLRPGDVRSDMRVVVTEGGDIDLQVLMADGREPEFASLMLRKLIDGEPEGELRHDGFEGGRTLIEGLSEGEWWVKTTVFDLSGVQGGEDPAQEEREQVVSVRSGEVTEVLIQY
ncbi:MAG: hypothetical protein MK291_12335, partial [Planctomycetes bacterium]|nr:hypothetical protein [Planctomycetota bacterium]